jgi:hypothetical protein
VSSNSASRSRSVRLSQRAIATSARSPAGSLRRSARGLDGISGWCHVRSAGSRLDGPRLHGSARQQREEPDQFRAHNHKASNDLPISGGRRPSTASACRPPSVTVQQFFNGESDVPCDLAQQGR